MGIYLSFTLCDKLKILQQTKTKPGSYQAAAEKSDNLWDQYLGWNYGQLQADYLSHQNDKN